MPVIADQPEIVITASREPIAASEAPVSLSIIDSPTIEALSLPLAHDLARLTPGLSVAVSGSPGSLTQIRIRGAEANHTLLFIDGIAFNDPASGNQARFETLATDGLGQIEIVRGPQSALWGSEALGGVIALTSPDPLGSNRLTATAEYGSHDAARASVGVVAGSDSTGISATASYLRNDGVDIFGGGSGDRDGFENFTLGLKGITRPSDNSEIGVAARYIQAESEFDGTPPPFFTRADTREESKAETAAVRGWARIGLAPDAPWSAQVEAQYLRSENRNFNARVHTNDTIGDRYRLGGQAVHRDPARIDRGDRARARDIRE